MFWSTLWARMNLHGVSATLQSGGTQRFGRSLVRLKSVTIDDGEAFKVLVVEETAITGAVGGYGRTRLLSEDAQDAAEDVADWVLQQG